MAPQSNEPVCCPPFQPQLWDDKMVEWHQKPFVRHPVRTLFYMPLNFGGVIRKVHKKILASGTDIQDWLCFSDHVSRWRMDIYLAVGKEVAGVDNITLSGQYYCKVYEGPFKDTGRWCRDYEAAVVAKGLKAGKLLMWYTTCPKCARKYGKNYVVVVGQIG